MDRRLRLRFLFRGRGRHPERLILRGYGRRVPSFGRNFKGDEVEPMLRKLFGGP